MTPGFATRYGCNRLVFYEAYERMDEAIAREKQIKGGSRAKKIALIETMNPEWKDLYESLA
jgi:predicted GIY-YIG superfamily endonuclease